MLIKVILLNYHKPTLLVTVGWVTGETLIAGFWKEHHEELLNSSDNKSAKYSVLKFINEGNQFGNDMVVTLSEMQKCIDA